MGIQRTSPLTLLLLHILCFLQFTQPLQSQGKAFSRQPARSLILTPKQRADSEPEQVQIKSIIII